MVVCFYSGIFARLGGIEEFTRDLAISLLDAGIEVRIICASLRNPILDELTQRGVRVIRVPFFWGCRWNLPDLVLLPVAIAKMRDVDVVMHQKPFIPWFYKFLTRRPRHIFLTAYRPLDQFGSAKGIHRFFSFFDMVITQVKSFKEEFLDAGVEAPIHVLPLMPPAVSNAANLSPCNTRLRVGMMGRIESQKNPLYALKILQELASSRSATEEIEFHVHGSGSLQVEMERRAMGMKLDVVFHGAYVRSEVPSLVAAYDLFLITSVSEGQCIVALEILAGGRPLFATPVGALPEILSDPVRGSLLPENDAPAAARQIGRWLEEHRSPNPQAIQKSYFSNYNREQIERAYVELVGRLANES